MSFLNCESHLFELAKANRCHIYVSGGELKRRLCFVPPQVSCILYWNGAKCLVSMSLIISTSILNMDSKLTKPSGKRLCRQLFNNNSHDPWKCVVHWCVAVIAFLSVMIHQRGSSDPIRGWWSYRRRPIGQHYTQEKNSINRFPGHWQFSLRGV